MMSKVRCEAGDHVYDNERYATCPNCPSNMDDLVIPSTQGYQPKSGGVHIDKTVSLDQLSPEPIRRGGTEPVKNNLGTKTEMLERVGNFDPVVAWLVVLSDDNKGRDFRVVSGWNSLGRDVSAKICIEFDSGVSRGKHAYVIYDNETNEFFVKHADGIHGTRLNDRMVGDLTPLSQGDIIRVGQTELLFVPLCNERFNWFKKDEKESESK